MRKISLLFIAFLCCCTLTAQPKNSIRIGAGAGLRSTDGPDTKSSFAAGPAVNIEYERNLNKYFAFNANAFSASVHFGKQMDQQMTSLSAGAIFTPLPEHFRYFRFGARVGWAYQQYYYPESHLYGTYNNFREHGIGFDFPIRIFFIDNEKYELFFDYTITTRWSKWRYKQSRTLQAPMDNAGVYFGLKF